MVAPRKRSRSLRRVYVKAPGGRNVVHYTHRKPNAAKCSCGARLSGIPRERPYKMRRMAKSRKRVSRPYGGFLCSRCMRKLFAEKARRG